jgi:preprotein translocase subunit SecB
MTDLSVSSKLQLAGRLGAIAQLQAIELRSVQFRVEPRLQVTFPMALNVHTNLSVNGSVHEDTLRYGVSAKTAGTLHDGSVLFASEAEYAVVLVAPGVSAREEELAAYGEVSIAPMVFPHVRELFSSLTGRTGLPAVTMPPYRVALR